MILGMRLISLSLPLLLLAISINGGPLMPEGEMLGSETFLPQMGNPTLLGSFPIHNEKNTWRSSYSDVPISVAESLCTTDGVFSKAGSCRYYYKCERLMQPGLFSVHLFSCPHGTVFDVEQKSCELPHRVTTRPDCLGEATVDIDLYAIDTRFEDVSSQVTSAFIHPNHNRQKRFAIIPVLTGLLSHPLTKAAVGLFGSFRKNKKSSYPGMDLKGLESKLVGIDGKIKKVQLSVLESQVENKMNAEILKNLISKGTDDTQASFEVTQNLINQGILENQISSAVIQGLISQQSSANENHFEKVQVSLGELKSFINNEITHAKSDIKKGFESVSSLIDQSKVEPLVSKLLTAIKNFNQRSNHIQSLPEKNRIDAIKRSGGYLEYLESSTIQDSLYDIIQQSMAIPDNDSDLSAVFILDLLIHGLQVHANTMSSVILSNSYLAAKALEETNLDEFNTYMLRVSSSTARMKLELGSASRQGLIGEIKGVLERVQQLPYASDIPGLSQLLVEKRANLNQLESDIESLITDNVELSEPRSIKGKPNFSASSVSVPIASWEKGRSVRYAIQHVSETGISRVGAWSAPYNIGDKACPTIELPVVPQDIVRVVYRRFDQEHPERIAVLRNNEQKLFRDIDRDLLNAAANPNEDQAVKEVTSLTDDSANVIATIGNKMTPLHYAAKHGNTKVIEILMNKGANIHAKTSDNEEPLHFAALFGSTEGVEYLISKGARVNAQTRLLGLSPLHIAVANNHVDATLALIRQGAFINIKDNNGLTPLHISIRGNGDTTEVLLKNDDINVNAIANDGLTPLHYAARSSNEVFVRKLLQHKDIDINPQTDSLLSPLHLAAMGDNMADIVELVQRGVPVSVADESGSTPLHYAAFFGNQAAAMTLIQSDPSLPNIKNNDDKLALDLAMENGKENVANILRNGGDTFVSDTTGESADTELDAADASASEQLLEANCTTDIVEQMAKSSEETCAHIGNIESYVNLVMSMIPLEIYYETQEEYSLIFKNYDRDLVVAQGHARIWRNGDSIVQGIGQTFELAKAFEPEFTRKYRINQQRVEVIKENVDQVKLINDTKDEINKLEEQLASATEAMNQVKVPAVMQYFRITISDIEASIEENNRVLKEDFTLIQELAELVDFLEFVRRDSDKIRTIALATKGKIETFRDNLEHDKGAFERHGRISSETFERLQEETIKNNKALAENKRKQEELDLKIEEERQQVKALYVKINESHKQLRDMRRKLLDQISKSKKWKKIGAILTPVVVGAFLYRNARKEEKKYGSLLEKTMTESKLEVDVLNEQIERNHRDILFFQEQMANSTSNSDQLRNEINDFITLDGDLKTMADKVETLLEAINKALVGVRVIKGVFDDVTKKLGDMIELAKTAKTEAEKLNAKYFIYNELSSLECNWRDVYLKVMNLDECTRNFQILY